LQNLRKLLVPFSVLYDGVTAVRNKAFDLGWLPQNSYPVRTIAVGNLSTGGTGKTPMVEFLIDKFLHTKTNQPKNLAILSRGYGRKTTGFLKTSDHHTAEDVGDEPLQFFHKYGDQINIYVCEDRRNGMRQILNSNHPDLIILDDAYQHRYVQANHYILLTTFQQPYYKDLLLPAGNLRESMRYRNRATDIVVTKCPPETSAKTMEEMTRKLKPLSHQRVSFATLAYGDYLIGKNNQKQLKSLEGQQVVLVTGIARPEPMVDYLSQFVKIDHWKYGDHHRFRESELNKIAAQPIIITTEKDYMRLKDHGFANLYYLPVKTEFLSGKLKID